LQRFLDSSATISVWDNQAPPRIEIDSGEMLRVAMRDASGGQVEPGMSAEAFARIDFERIHALSGPIAIRGARPGDTLKVEILRYEHKGRAWTSVHPEMCFLPEDFTDFFLQHWALEGNLTRSIPGLVLPLEPFCGIVGTQPPEPGRFRTRAPGRFGGNMDVRRLVQGSVLYLPVFVPGAGLCVGDAHAAQGNGEVSLNGMEAPMDVDLRVSLSTDVRVEAPYLLSPPPVPPPAYREKPYHAFIASGSDPLGCARDATRRAIDFLAGRAGLSPEQALVVCSVALDLSLSQVVNLPHYTVTGYLPEGIFL